MKRFTIFGFLISVIVVWFSMTLDRSAAPFQRVADGGCVGIPNKAAGQAAIEFSEHLIADKYAYAYGIAAADFDVDGDLDLTSED